jgi:transcriptional repressor NrdR
VPLAALESLVSEVERELERRGEREVSSQEIGELVMERLRRLDDVAYVRFASVYRQFGDLQRFKEELDRIVGGSRHE